MTIGEGPRVVEPLRITAALEEPTVKGPHPIALDALLMRVHAMRGDLLTPRTESELVEIAIPIVRENGVHLCSFAQFTVREHEQRHRHKRPPIQGYIALGSPKIKRVDVSVAEDKLYRLPYSLQHVRDRTLTWYAMGDAEMLRGLLSDVHYLGKLTGYGLGKLALHATPWAVAPCETWPGFPVVRDGKALRNLPQDWPGLFAPKLGIRCVTPPYWMRSREVLCAVPG